MKFHPHPHLIMHQPPSFSKSGGENLFHHFLKTLSTLPAPSWQAGAGRAVINGAPVFRKLEKKT
jgi:hypothetical protein